MYTQLGGQDFLTIRTLDFNLTQLLTTGAVLSKGTIIEVNVSELGLTTAGGKVVWGRYAQIQVSLLSVNSLDDTYIYSEQSRERRVRERYTVGLSDGLGSEHHSCSRRLRRWKDIWQVKE